MKKYTTLFFDLDHTLWDFETNSKEALTEIFINNELKTRGGVSLDDFLSVYYKINDQMWDLYRKNKITKTELRNDRFYNSLLECGIDDRNLAVEIGDYYVKTSPYKTNLFEGCHEVLGGLKKEYNLHIITNGFDEVQHIKLEQSKLRHYFSEIITSERAGFKKPEKGIFDYSFELTGAILENSVMIGDGVETDILGARNIGMDQIYFDPHIKGVDVKATHRIEHLSELLALL